MLDALNWFQTHALVIAVPAFTLASIGLRAVADGFQVLGKKTPTWVGDALIGLGKITHFLNGSTPPSE